MTTADWRTHDTPEFREAFHDAQTRLDMAEFREDGDGYCAPGVEHYTHEMAAADEKVADRYDRLVLQPAHAEFEAQCEQAEFEAHWPEPADGARIEFEARGGTLYAAFRQDLPEHAGGSWWLYGSDERYTWRRLLAEFEIHDMGCFTTLVATEDACKALDRIVADYPISPGAGAGVTGDFHGWTQGRLTFLSGTEPTT